MITGVGLGTCLGVGATRVWQRILNGESGISVLRTEDPRFRTAPSIVGGIVPRGTGPGMLDEEMISSNDERQKYPSPTILGLAVSEIALNDAGYSKETLENLPQSKKERMGVCAGGIVSDFGDIVGLSSPREREGFHIFKLMHGSLATAVSTRYGLQGPSTTVVTACASGASAVGDSFRIIRDGYADFMLVGASQPFRYPSIVGSFLRTRLLCTRFQDAPEKASRPFDRDRSGAVPSEGAGGLVLEDYELAKARGARIYCEVLGYGMSGSMFLEYS